MGKWNMIFVMPAVLLPTVFLSTDLFSAQIDTGIQSLRSSNPQSTIQNLSSTSTGDPKLDSAAFAQKTKKLQIPFIANNGQVDKQVKYYAKTFGGTVFVTKEGEIVYSLPRNSSGLGVRGSENQEARCMIQDTRNMSNITRRVSRWANAIRPYTPNYSSAMHTQSRLLLSQTPSRRMSLHRTLPAHPPDHYWQ